MAINSSSTDTQVEAAFDDNADYESDTTLAKVRSFMQACRILLRRRTPTYTIAGRSVTRESLEQALKSAGDFHATMGGNTPRATHTLVPAWGCEEDRSW